MFTGIIEGIGRVLRIEQEGTNVHFELEAPFTSELKIDQSVAHNGVCLTVVEKQSNSFVVTAIQETLDRTNLGGWKVGDASEYSITIKCYHCKNEWSVEGITHKYKCTKCGRWGIGKSTL